MFADIAFGVGEDVDVEVVVLVELVPGAAVAWMKGLRLVNWSRVGCCLAGSAAVAAPPVDEATVEVSARPAAVGLPAP